MSASLVGSEMCIRDRRSLSCDQLGSSGGPWLRSFGALDNAVSPPGLAWTCLLYTSDAADDM
eukprot:7423448-Alexandrium_andersonii.AAC.1